MRASSIVGAKASVMGAGRCGATTASVRGRGGEAAWALGASRFGVAGELYRQREALRNGDDQADTDGFAGGVKLSITSPEFR